jgi:hypothetical protein
MNSQGCFRQPFVPKGRYDDYCAVAENVYVVLEGGCMLKPRVLRGRGIWFFLGGVGEEEGGRRSAWDPLLQRCLLLLLLVLNVSDRIVAPNYGKPRRPDPPCRLLDPVTRCRWELKFGNLATSCNKK